MPISEVVGNQFSALYLSFSSTSKETNSDDVSGFTWAILPKIISLTSLNKLISCSSVLNCFLRESDELFKTNVFTGAVIIPLANSLFSILWIKSLKKDIFSWSQNFCHTLSLSYTNDALPKEL